MEEGESISRKLRGSLAEAEGRALQEKVMRYMARLLSRSPPEAIIHPMNHQMFLLHKALLSWEFFACGNKVCLRVNVM